MQKTKNLQFHLIRLSNKPTQKKLNILETWFDPYNVDLIIVMLFMVINDEIMIEMKQTLRRLIFIKENNRLKIYYIEWKYHISGYSTMSCRVLQSHTLRRYTCPEFRLICVGSSEVVEFLVPFLQLNFQFVLKKKDIQVWSF